jgi:galactose oxidase-like protein
MPPTLRTSSKGLPRACTIASIGVLTALSAACGSDEPKTTEPDDTKPPASVGHALVFHESRGKVLLLNAGLGGMDDSREIGRPTRIWEWDGIAWRLIDSSGPPIRNLAGVAYDSRRNVIVLHGGTASASLNYGETWEWGASGWTKRSDGGPGVRTHTQMAFDKARGRAVLFGGQNADATVFPNDTWEWDGNTWARAATSGPPPRVHHAMGYDAASGRVIVFGGYQPNVADLGDAWAWNGTQWTQLAGSSPRTHAQLGINPAGSAPMVVGGMTPSGPARTMLVFEQNAWRSVNADGPAPRYLTAVAYDPNRRVLVMYGGGATEGMTLYADTWEYDGTSWQRRAQ